MGSRKKKRQQGFTLVELSISLVIIALVVAAIVSGMELKRVAELRSVISDIHKFNTAIRIFENKYNYLPGDIYNASRYFPGCVDDEANLCNGNGDGEISPAYTEGLRVWQHLALSNILPGPYTGLMSSGGDMSFNMHDDLHSFIFPAAYAGGGNNGSSGGGGQEAWLVCHNGNTIEVANPAVLNAHLEHGDYLGECNDGSSSSG
ncbi:MAG: prepilin-type N-terminal cleavage/methylation domain-containing protein, partial [Candidatus Marinimicrobia bacterium]|nr:prepilin-type N-terminal cleavage/methylation domain-containing protein [Candidatus Neomarinimicrobiota bacterium]